MTKTLSIHMTLASAMLVLAGIAPALAAEPTYKADVPQSLMTPDKVQTEFLGELNFTDGMPSEETVKKTYDFIDLSRAVDSFLNGIPGTSIYAMLEGLKHAGAAPGDLVLWENLYDARSLLLTPQTTTPYAFAEINVKDEPAIVEVPAGRLVGAVDDAFFRWVTDLGATGPNQGKGGKYVFVGPDYQGDLPEGYHVVKTPTYRNWMFLRALVQDGDLEAATLGLRTQFRIYPLSKKDNPPQGKVVQVSGKKFNTIHANDYSYWEELNAVVQYEPADAISPELVGQFAAIGIKKGKPFAPDARMKKILEEGVAIGNATARSITFRPRTESVYFYPGKRQWYSCFAGGSHEFMNNGELVLDDRIMFHYYATGITPAMAQPKVGTGSAYEIGAHDSQGRYLDGSKTYSCTLPGPVPAKDFWSFMVYDNQTRSVLETDQKLGGLDSTVPGVKSNADGSYTVWFGPTAPEGQEGNWVQTMPGKGYNVLLRLYGPLQEWFDKTWMPGDFELVE
ncbi:MAG: DUF1254 domain-containing protein [Planctomycetota bacterium]|nr:DUF1254 domain-containing protein [Planctomycetota bacterium]